MSHSKDPGQYICRHTQYTYRHAHVFTMNTSMHVHDTQKKTHQSSEMIFLTFSPCVVHITKCFPSCCMSHWGIASTTTFLNKPFTGVWHLHEKFYFRNCLHKVHWMVIVVQKMLKRIRFKGKPKLVYLMVLLLPVGQVVLVANSQKTAWVKFRLQHKIKNYFI